MNHFKVLMVVIIAATPVCSKPRQVHLPASSPTLPRYSGYRASASLGLHTSLEVDASYPKLLQLLPDPCQPRGMPYHHMICKKHVHFSNKPWSGPRSYRIRAVLCTTSLCVPRGASLLC
ncbi:hypothetical protein K438DRAFT_221392 [Mycena galopus ATCC 62051]|nr:hypothetical protein K438DRAFT_221392 [Mycena galopus ATCC 62051]